MNKEYYERLKYLASNHLHCRLDDNVSSYIPPDLKERTYRWSLYIFSNLYEVGEDTFDPVDRKMFIELGAFFKKEHLINWTREKLIELDKKKFPQISDYLQDRIHTTTSFYELKVCLYVLRELHDDWHVIDQFIIDRSPGFKEFIV